MTAIDNTPPNRNFLSPLGLKLVIKRAPNLDFFVQAVNLPSILLPNRDIENPFTVAPEPGDHIKFEPLTIKFKVDEDFQNYMEVYNWIMHLGFPDNWDQYKEIEQVNPITGEGKFSDISLIALNSVYHSNYETVYRDAWPTSLSALEFVSTDKDVKFITATVTFHYTLFTVAKIA